MTDTEKRKHKRSIRIQEELWQRARALAQAREQSVAELMESTLRKYAAAAPSGQEPPAWTPRRVMLIDDEVWAAAQQAAETNGETVSDAARHGLLQALEAENG